jgi:hypothetical protein
VLDDSVAGEVDCKCGLDEVLPKIVTNLAIVFDNQKSQL